MIRSDSTQAQLDLRRQMQPVSDSIIAAQPSMTAAIRLCQQLSGLEDKELVGKCGIVGDTAQWSRIVKSGQHFFPQDKFTQFMQACGNEAPLLWMARKMGYGLVRLESETEIMWRLEREKREEVEKENALLKKILKGN